MEIYPAKPNNVVSEDFVNLYNRMIRLTSGSSICDPYYYHIYVKCQIKLQDGWLVYYINEITGDSGEYFNHGSRNPFKIILNDKKLVALTGSLSSLIKALNILEVLRILRNKGAEQSTVLRYKPTSCSFIEKEIHQWVMKGCPNHHLTYQLNIVNNEMSVLTISTADVSVNLLGISNRFINIIDKTTGDRWTFTDNPNYSHVYSQHYTLLRISSDCFIPAKTTKSMKLIPMQSIQGNNNTIPHFVTSKLKTRAKTLLLPLKELLLQ